MSPRWRDEVALHLAPRRLVLLRAPRGLRAAGQQRDSVEVEDGHFANWTATLRCLRTQLSQPGWRNANVRVVMSDHWTRYAVVPWNAELEGAHERLAHARLLLQQVYGDIVDEWTVVLSEAVPPRAAVASAVSSQLLTELNEVLTGAGLRLLSLQPHLIAAYNAWRSRLPRQGGWLVCVDEGVLAAAQVGIQGWEQVHVVRIGSDWSAELHRLRAFGRLVHGAGDQRVFVDAPAWLRGVAATGIDSVEWLDQPRSRSGPTAPLVAMRE